VPTTAAADPPPAPGPRRPDERINRRASIPFFALHVVAVVGVVIFGVTTQAFVLFLVMVFGRTWFITAGYHRYFSHRAYRTSRAFQLVLAMGGATCAQKGPLWWAGHHREHHRHSDTERDVHSPLRGFWWSHVGWVLCDRYDEVPTERIKDFARFPELRFVDRWNGLFPWLAAVACLLIAGWPGLFLGFFMATVVVWHNTFLVNSLTHVMGRRRYVTTDTSRNNLLVALTTLGEGWHNNHHYHQSSARNGFFWWELDVTWYVLKALSWIGVVRDLKVPGPEVLAANRVADGNFDVGEFRAHCTRARTVVAEAHLRPGAAPTPLRSGTPDQQLAAAQLDIELEKAQLDEMLLSAVAASGDLQAATRRSNRPTGPDAS
jgi:stearoyl-CoA desaturase (delta-9 desaturase)